jgi:methyl-accepting chemotaxis protein
MSVVLVVATGFVIGGGIIVVGEVRDLGAAWKDYAEGPVEKGIHLGTMERHLGYGGMIHQFKNYVLRRTPDRLRKAKAATREFHNAAENYRRQSVNPRESEALKAISAVVDEYSSNLDDIENMVAKGMTTTQIDAVVKVDDKPAFDGLDVLRQEFVKARDAGTTEVANRTGAIVGLTTNNAVITGIILIGVVILLLWFTHLRLLRPLREMVSCMGDLADGNYRVEIPALGRNDEIGDMAAAVDVFRTNAANLDNVTQTVTQATHEVTNASKEISAGSIDLSQRTEHQAASIEETSASMAQVASTVAQNARNADDASKLARNTRQLAEGGRSVVDGAVKAMGAIEDSSQKISDILGVIDEIAFQTNLLALNAAVEAARAGDAGRGFAVVATEVGKLARRSSDSAKDIKDLIATSENQVRQGVKLVDETGMALSEIVSSVGEVTDLISEIAVASKQQADSIQEVNTAITHMDEMTQQNSALVEESAAATRALEDQAVFLNQSVSGLDRGERQRERGAPPGPYTPQRPAPVRPVRSAAKPTGQDGAKDLAFDDDDWEEF